MTTAIGAATRNLLTQHELPTGTTLENRVTWRLHRWKALDKTQYRLGPYRLDFAWPAAKIALEVDGPHHWQPDVAVRDVARAHPVDARNFTPPWRQDWNEPLTPEDRADLDVLEAACERGFTLATRCLRCNQWLVAPSSVRAHLGPVCRAKAVHE